MLWRSPWIHVPAGALLLLVPALVNGFPFWYFDTVGYHQLGESIVRNVGDIIASAPPPSADRVQLTAQQDGPVDENASLSYIGGRAPIYGLFIYLSYALGSYWIAAILQAALAAWLVSACLRALDLAAPRPYVLTIAGALAFTSLPYFATTLMPDVFTGFAFLLVGVLFAAANRFHPAERAALMLLLAASVAVHQTNVPLASLLVVISIGAAIAAGARWRHLRARIIVTAAPILLAIVFNAAYAQAVRIALGDTPSSPPYLMARVLTDGPGRLYLREVCSPEPQFEICRYADRPFTDVNDFLWNPDPSVGVFMVADTDSRRRLVAEERRFVLGALSRHPVEQLVASASNALQLLPRYQVDPELRLGGDAWRELNFGALAPRDDSRARNSLVFRGAFPFKVIDLVNGFALAFAAMFLLWRLTRADIAAALRVGMTHADRETNTRRALATVAVALLIWLAANAVMCGTLSGVFGRYQARTMWLTPLLAMLVYLRLGARPAAATPRVRRTDPA